MEMWLEGRYEVRAAGGATDPVDPQRPDRIRVVPPSVAAQVPGRPGKRGKTG